MNLILFLIFGLVVGALARVIVPGREPGGWLASMLLGVAGAFLGGLIGRAFGLYTSDVTTGGFVMSLIGAIILVTAGYGAFITGDGARAILAGRADQGPHVLSAAFLQVGVVAP